MANDRARKLKRVVIREELVALLCLDTGGGV